MWKGIAIYFCVQIIIFLIILLMAKRKDKRLQDNHGTEVPNGYIFTGEVYFDPTTREKYEVYYNKIDGKRFHKKCFNEK